MRSHTDSLKMNPCSGLSFPVWERPGLIISSWFIPYSHITSQYCHVIWMYTFRWGVYSSWLVYSMWVREEKTQYSIKMLMASVGRGICSDTGQKSNRGKPLDWGWNLRIFPVLLCLQNKGSPNCLCANFKYIYV